MELPEDVLAVLPADPFEQLNIAQKITSIALTTRVSGLEDEVSSLQHELEGKDDVVAELRAQLVALEASLSDVSRQLARTEEEKEALVSENASLSSTVKKLNRDLSKLEIFKKTLMQSLQDEDKTTVKHKTGASDQTTPKQLPNITTLPYAPLTDDDDDDNITPTMKLPSLRTQVTEAESAISDDVNSTDTDVFRQGVGLVLTSSLSTTSRLTPPESPKKHSASGSAKPSRTVPTSRRNSISSTSARGEFEERSVFSSVPSTTHSSISGSLDSSNQTGRGRVDGKEFFRQVRSRLSYEQFSAFLANVKEMNSHKQTREETLQKADEIFGTENRDLYAIFERLVGRSLH